jgi:hypothetical protein
MDRERDRKRSTAERRRRRRRRERRSGGSTYAAPDALPSCIDATRALVLRPLLVTLCGEEQEEQEEQQERRKKPRRRPQRYFMCGVAISNRFLKTGSRQA